MAATQAVPTRRLRAPTSRPAEAARPDLRVVPPHRPTAAIVSVALIVIFGVLLATAALNTMLVSGQRDLDRIESDISDGQQRNQGLALRVAELESPERIVEAATRDGMIEPDEVTWVTPQPDGTSDAVTAPAAGRDERATGIADDDDEVGDTSEASADGGPDGSGG